MSKFKVGDKVRRTYGRHWQHKVGIKDVVLGVNPDGRLLFIDRCLGHSYDPANYELVEETIDLTKLDKPYKDLSIEEKVALLEAELRGEVIEYQGQFNEWKTTYTAHEKDGYAFNCKYRVQTKPTENELKKTSILEKMEELKQELESLEIR